MDLLTMAPPNSGATDRVKVAFISEYFYPEMTGGTPGLLSNLTRYLKDHYENLQIEVITSRNLYRTEGAPLPNRGDWQGITIHRLGTPKSNRFSAPLRLGAGLIFTTRVLLELLARSRYDLLVVVTSPPMLPIAAWAVKAIRKTPYVYLVHDLYPDVAVTLNVLRRDSVVARLTRRMQRMWLHAANRTVVLGRCMREHLATSYGLPTQRMDVIPNWSDARMPAAVPVDSRRRGETQPFVVLYGGNFGLYQDFDTVLDAAHTLRETCREIEFVFVGDGAQKEHICRRVTQERLTNVAVYPLMPQSEYASLLATADVCLVTLAPGAEGLCVPSKFYGILAAGKTTVAVVERHSEVSRVLSEADCGVQLDPGDAHGLAATLKALHQTPQVVRRMGENARAVFAQRYTLAKTAPRYVATFLAAMAHAGGSPVQRRASGHSRLPERLSGAARVLRGAELPLGVGLGAHLVACLRMMRRRRNIPDRKVGATILSPPLRAVGTQRRAIPAESLERNR